MRRISALLVVGLAGLLMAGSLQNGCSKKKETPKQKTKNEQAQPQPQPLPPPPPAETSLNDPRDGKVYKTIQIGTQTWLAENLAYKAKSGCWAYGGKKSNVEKYGYLYDWQTAMKVCPAGWHLPSETEWTQLIDCMGGDKIAAGKLKSTSDWKSPNLGAENSSGFSALPAGYRFCFEGMSKFGFGNSVGTFEEIGCSGCWWSATAYNSDNAWARILDFDSSGVRRDYFHKTYGYSVRCVKDQ